jgi:hypothetical protein
MLTYREEYQLHVCREHHLACLIGWCAALSAAVACVLLVALGAATWLLSLSAGFALLAVLFFLRGRRPLRHMRALEEFR